MHESSLARQILDTALARLRDERARRVLAVKGWIAETETLSTDSLSFHFAIHAHGTPAEGARLELRVIHVRARCGACGTTYAPEHHVLVCPACGDAEGVLLDRTGLGIDALELEAS